MIHAILHNTIFIMHLACKISSSFCDDIWYSRGGPVTVRKKQKRHLRLNFTAAGFALCNFTIVLFGTMIPFVTSVFIKKLVVLVESFDQNMNV